MGRSSCQKFVKSFDRYDKTVSLKYKKKGMYATSIGGVCSIMTFTFLVYWLAVNVWFTFVPPGAFKTSNSMRLI